MAGHTETAGASLVDSFPGPPALEAIVPALRHLPPGVAFRVMEALGVADGIARRGRWGRAVRWARARGDRSWRAHLRAFHMLRMHGHFLALEGMLGTETLEATRASSVVHGALDGLRQGAILLDMHVGPPRTWLSLRAHGYPVVAAVRRQPVEGTVLHRWSQEGSVITLPIGDSTTRVAGLYQLRQAVARGALAYMLADGQSGTELFRLDAPGQPRVRSGWYEYRRMLRVPVVPVLAHREGRRTVVTIHPPLPPLAADAEADRDACRLALSSIVARYIDEHPDNCRYLAFADRRRAKAAQT